MAREGLSNRCNKAGCAEVALYWRHNALYGRQHEKLCAVHWRELPEQERRLFERFTVAQ